MRRFICLFLAIAMCIISGCKKENSTGTKKEDVQDNAQIIESVPDTKKNMDGVFRYANFGDDIEKVKASEGTPYEESNTILCYKDIKLMGFNTYTSYFFGDNGFMAGSYAINETHTNNTSYIEDFKEIKNALIEKYGKPNADDEKWSKELFKDDPGTALEYGILEFNVLWFLDNVTIVHTLNADNFKISHTIHYINPKEKIETDKTGL